MFIARSARCNNVRTLNCSKVKSYVHLVFYNHHQIMNLCTWMIGKNF